MNIKSLILCSVAITAITGLLNAQDSIKTQLVVIPSRYIEVQSFDITRSNNEGIGIEGKFLVAGKGIYGHFEAVAYNDSGFMLQRVSSEDVTYRRGRGAKTKTVDLYMNNRTSCSKIEVTFHEMRETSDTGDGIK
jgi:hypothetical protein